MRPTVARFMVAGLLATTLAGCGAADRDGNSLGMKFVEVPGTNFAACVHETRLADYKAFVEATGHRGGVMSIVYHGVGDMELAEDPNQSRSEEHPVTNLREADANAFCRWLTARELEDGSLEPHQVYRLPTADEWGRMLAAGMDTTSVYPWGDQWPPPPAYGNYLDGDEQRWATEPLPDYDDGYPYTAPVMSYEPNLIGLYDLSGNLWELCLMSSAPEAVYGLRGGSYQNSAERSLNCGATLEIRRGGYYPSDAVGFRCIRVPGDGTTPAAATAR